MRFSAVATLAVAGVLVLGACEGHGDHGSSSASTAAPTSVAADAPFNAADVTFVQGMIPHHEQALEMATLALDAKAGAGSAVIDLAERIQGAQDPEIVLMRGWLADWGQVEMGDMADHGMAPMDGMMSAADMTRLGTLTGTEFDTAWLQMMIEHHAGAVKMAETVKASGKHPDVAALADQVIAAQTSEITEMQGLLGA